LSGLQAASCECYEIVKGMSGKTSGS